MHELDHIVVANAPKIPCTLRTLKPFSVAGMKPFVHAGEVSDAILYLASRAGLPDEEIRALKELLERLSFSLKALQEKESESHQENVETEAARIGGK